jgi:DNA polymerase I
MSGERTMSTKKTVVCDIETNGLIPQVDTIWCIVCKDWDTGEITSFTPDTLDDFKDYANDVHTWIGHNFIAYDARVLRKVLGIKIRPSRVYDTLIISRLQQMSREGGHSLKNWGKILNFGKGEYNDWSQYTEEMLEYCIQDVELTYKVAESLKLEGGNIGSELSQKIEHACQHLLENQREYGFKLDVPQAHKLFTLVKSRAEELEQKILLDFLPLPKFIKEVTPKYKKDGTLSSVGLKLLGKYWTSVGGSFSLIRYEEFNLNSPKQKLQRLAGHWSPTLRTKGYRKLCDKLRNDDITQEEFDAKEPYTYTINDDNLATMYDDAPQTLKYLGEYAMCTARAKEIEGWFDGQWNDDGRVHGTVLSVGAGTHRMSHKNPNMANIPGRDSPYGPDCRRCWTVSDPDEYCLLGTDAAGIQLRLLAHYMNDKDYTNEVLEGDVHTKNQLAAGLPTRDNAKTFIYSWLMGAGSERIGRIIGGTPHDGKQITDKFLDNTPALDKFRGTRIRGAAESGGLVGFDGRWIEIKSEHFGMSVFLQGGEQSVMKWAMLEWHRQARRAGLDFHQVAVVHDEFQTEVHRDHAEQLGEIQCQAIRDAGTYFKLNCPMDGEYNIGNNWSETH